MRELRAANRLADSAGMTGELGPYGVPDGPDGTISLGAAVLEAYGGQLARGWPKPTASMPSGAAIGARDGGRGR